MKNYYEILGVVPDCSQEEIKKAYRKLARTYHPDTCSGGDSSQFRAVQEAYENLGNSEKRQAYDYQLNARRRQSRSESQQPNYRWETFFANPLSFENYFAHLYHLMAGQPGLGDFLDREDYELELILTPEEARTGGTVPLPISLPVICPTCHGRAETAWFVCDRCLGMGYVNQNSIFNLKFQPHLAHQSRYPVFIPGYGTIIIRVIIR